MDKENYFGRYSLCSDSLDKLNAIKEPSANINSETADAWRIISWEEPERTTTVEQESSENKEEAAESLPHLSQDLLPATQYGCSQMDWSSTKLDPTKSIENLTDFIYESLELGNGKLDTEFMKDITDSELSTIVNDLNKKLSHRGIYNLCRSICDMKIELSERFVSFLCRDVFLNAIISNEEQSRLLNAAITDCVSKFPEDVQNLTFIPLLNFDVKELTTIKSITSKLNVQQKRAYISDLSTEVKDLKQWHIFVVQDLLVANLEEDVKEKILNLLWHKSYDFSKDKNYGKLVLNLLKTNPSTTAEQKHLYEDIISVHNTLFKKLIHNTLESVSIA